MICQDCWFSSGVGRGGWSPPNIFQVGAQPPQYLEQCFLQWMLACTAVWSASQLLNSLRLIQSSCYSTDIDFGQLQMQLPLLASLIRQTLPNMRKVTSIRSYEHPGCIQINAVRSPQHFMAVYDCTNQVSHFWKIILKVVNTYLRSSMSEQLNNCFTKQLLTPVSGVHCSKYWTQKLFWCILIKILHNALLYINPG